MPFSFDTPQLLLLALPVLWLWWTLAGEAGSGTHETPRDERPRSLPSRSSGSSGSSGSRLRATQIVRLALALLLVAALAGPAWRRGLTGTDCILVLDRSLSMPEGADEAHVEIVGLAEGARDKADRVGVITFGARAAVEKAPSREGFSGTFTKTVDPGASDLASALEQAAVTASAGRRASVLVVSDGEYTGRDPLRASSALGASSVPVYYRHMARPPGADAAAVSLDLPEAVERGARFQFTARVWADRAMPTRWALVRDRRPVARGTRALARGETVFFLRDVAATPGLHTYAFVIDPEGDTRPENNRATGALRVSGPARVLVLNERGDAGGLAAALRSGGVEVKAVSSGAADLSTPALESYRAVCLENVPAGDLGRTALKGLRRWVESSGTGLLVTGGRSSLGAGGYHRSPIDEALPVSMELREELRKGSVALVSVLDRSGSMAAPVGTGGGAGGGPAPRGRTKMDLAALGASATIELLSDRDEVGVIAVDSSAHVIQPLAPAAQKAAMIARVRSIRSMGGGIFIFVGLTAGAKMLAQSSIMTKHLVLFADAADSEEPGDYKSLLTKMRAAGMTVSVIGLGSDSDSDADLLRDIAKRGGGEVSFTNRADDLPRLFSQEVMRVARSSFIEEPTRAKTLSGMLELGPLGDVRFPEVGGYNASFLRPGASAAACTVPAEEGEEPSPLLAFWRRGLGRTAVLAAEVDGEFSGGFTSWKDRTRFLSTLGRWLAGNEPASLGRVRVRRSTGEAEVLFEIEPGRELAVAAASPALVVLPPGEETPPERIDLRWKDERTLSARIPLTRPGHYFHSIDFGELGALRGPPLSVSYPAEFLPPGGRGAERPAGEETLRRIAEATGGGACTDLATLFETKGGAAPGREDLPVGWLVAAVAAALLIAEVAGRRLALWERLGGAARGAVGRGMAAVKSVRMIRRARGRAPAPLAAGQGEREGVQEAGPEGAGEEGAAAASAASGEAAAAEAAKRDERPGLDDALAKAKSRTRRRPGR